MKKKTQLSRSPFSLHRDMWVYEEPGGLVVIGYDAEQRQIRGTIPWRKVRQALGRKDSGLGR